MSFGANNDLKRSINNLGGISNQLTNESYPYAMDLSKNFVSQGGNLFNLGQGTINQGTGNINSGADFFRTLLQGNKSNTAAVLQPTIDQIRAGNTNALTAINTLMPRGGGRYGALFSTALTPQSQIGNLFGSTRTVAASALPSIGSTQANIGLGQQGLGAGLYNTGVGALNAGTGALSTATGANSVLGQQGALQEQLRRQAMSSLFGGLFNILTMPLGNLAGTPLGKLGGLFGLGTP